MNFHTKCCVILNKYEFKRLIAVIDAHRHSDRNKIIFYLSFYAGLRACEIASLTINDVVNNDYVVNNEIVLEAHMTKGNQRSVVILSKVLQKHLQSFIDAYSASTTPNMPLIRSQKSKSFSPLTITQLFAKFYAKAGINGASGHSGRRQFITELADRQINIRVIQTLARHKHLNTTARYIDINSTKLHNAVDAVKLFS